MPSATVKSMAEKHGISVDKAEEYWDKAKGLAVDQGHKESEGDDYWAYVTGIFKRMCGETASSPYLTTLRKHFEDK